VIILDFSTHVQAAQSVILSRCPAEFPISLRPACWQPLKIGGVSDDEQIAGKTLLRLLNSVVVVEDDYHPLNLDLVHLTYRSLIDTPLEFTNLSPKEGELLRQLSRDKSSTGISPLTDAGLEYVKSQMSENPTIERLLLAVLNCSTRSTPAHEFRCSGEDRHDRWAWLKYGVAPYVARWAALTKFNASGWAPYAGALESYDTGQSRFDVGGSFFSENFSGCVLWVDRKWMDHAYLRRLASTISRTAGAEEAGKLQIRSIGGPGLAADPTGLVTTRFNYTLGYVVGMTFAEADCRPMNPPRQLLERATGLVIQPINE